MKKSFILAASVIALTTGAAFAHEDKPSQQAGVDRLAMAQSNPLATTRANTDGMKRNAGVWVYDRFASPGTTQGG